MKEKPSIYYYVWVNSYGAVSAILPNGEQLGLLPSEFDVTEWHNQGTNLERSVATEAQSGK